MEVPAISTMGQSPAELELDEEMKKPGAVTSGLMRPPTANPVEEKSAISPSWGQRRGQG